MNKASAAAYLKASFFRSLLRVHLSIGAGCLLLPVAFRRPQGEPVGPYPVPFLYEESVGVKKLTDAKSLPTYRIFVIPHRWRSEMHLLKKPIAEGT